MRLDKYLADMGFGSRKDVKALIKVKKVSVNGVIVTKADFDVKDHDEVMCDGKLIQYLSYEYILLNKPAAYVCANEDRRHPTVMELIGAKRKDLFTIGRLDKDTEGVLLISNDGTLAHRLIAPKYQIAKTYYAELDNDLPDNAKDLLEKPMDLGDFVTMGGQFNKLSKRSANLTISEGKFHQVKRMFEKLGCNVTYLRRESFAFIKVEDLPLGAWRYLDSEEVAKLKALVGLND